MHKQTKTLFKAAQPLRPGMFPKSKVEARARLMIAYLVATTKTSSCLVAKPTGHANVMPWREQYLAFG